MDYKKYKLKITDLPNNISETEIQELLPNWDISKFKVVNYTDNSIAYLEFYSFDAMEYFIKAFDKTDFDNIIIKVFKN